MWLILAFASAALLGFYDVFKKQALKANDVVVVLTLNTLFGSLIFLPFVLLSAGGQLSSDSLFYVPVCGWDVHQYIILKAVIVLASWLCGYFALQNLPLTIVGPINATRPVMVLLGAILVFGERLNLYQWVGVLCAVFGFYLLSRSGKKEGIDFRHNRWIVLAVLASALGAVSALFDKYLLAPVETGGRGIDHMVVQSFFMFYQFVMMLPILWWTKKRTAQSTPLPDGRGRGWVCWKWSILLISLFLCAADFVYFYALTLPEALIAVVSMTRRGSVLVSFFVGALVFHEKNLRYKVVDLALVFLSMFFLYLGSQ